MIAAGVHRAIPPFPMSKRSAKESQEQKVRDLRARVARSRRRIDRSIHGTLDRAILFGSWRTFVERYPVRSLLAAAGVGMAASSLASGDRKGSRAALQWADSATQAIWHRVFSGLKSACSSERVQEETGRPGNTGDHHGKDVSDE